VVRLPCTQVSWNGSAGTSVVSFEIDDPLCSGSILNVDNDVNLNVLSVHFSWCLLQFRNIEC